VNSALSNYVKIKFQAEDPDDPRVAKVMKYMKTSGLPTYVIMKRKYSSVTSHKSSVSNDRRSAGGLATDDCEPSRPDPSPLSLTTPCGWDSICLAPEPCRRRPPRQWHPRPYGAHAGS